MKVKASIKDEAGFPLRKGGGMDEVKERLVDLAEQFVNQPEEVIDLYLHEYMKAMSREDWRFYQRMAEEVPPDANDGYQATVLDVLKTVVYACMTSIVENDQSNPILVELSNSVREQIEQEDDEEDDWSEEELDSAAEMYVKRMSEEERRVFNEAVYEMSLHHSSPNSPSMKDLLSDLLRHGLIDEIESLDPEESDNRD